MSLGSMYPIEDVICALEGRTVRADEADEDVVAVFCVDVRKRGW